MIYWLTGLPSAGKTTVAKALRSHLWERYGQHVALLDADDIRKTVNVRLGFSVGDRMENVLNIARMAEAVCRADGDAIVACIAPLHVMRQAAQRIWPMIDWYYLKCGEEERRRRDSKGLYALHDAGEITGLTGVDAPYEVPAYACQIDTEVLTPEDAAFDIAVTSNPPMEARSVFIGRWAPFHNGHRALIDRALDEGANPLIFVRRTNEWPTVGQRLNMIRYVYAGDPRVRVEVIDDVHSVCIGRNVGYDVIRYDMDEETESITGTEIRAMILAGNDAWKSKVPTEVAEVLHLDPR